MKAHVVVERHGVDGFGDIAALQQRRQARGKAQPLGVVAVVQRLDAEAVAGHEQALAVALPNRQGEHAVELGQHGLAPGVVGLEQDFRIALAEELVAQLAQFFAQLRVVINGAVKH